MNFRLRRWASMAALMLPLLAAAQTEAPKPPDNWFLQDEQQDQRRGVSADRAYNELLKGKPEPQPIIVAVIDGGVDVHHEDLVGRVWVNEKEKNGTPGKDDDGNGYVDDIYGWNFIGGKDSTSVNEESLELTRELVRLERLATKGPLSAADQKYMDTLRSVYTRELTKYRTQRDGFQGQYNVMKVAFTIVKQRLGGKPLTAENVAALTDSTQRQAMAKSVVMQILGAGYTEAQMDGYMEQLKQRVDFNLNKNFDARHIVGDDPNDLSNRSYGNNDVKGPDAGHGTHVAGIIAALRDNNLGARGVANPVRIMAIRAVPNGDERDKDVANAIRYAVDNGARIINMSFGKDFSPQKQYVDEAVRYAEQKGVLLIHAAGNDARDLDRGDNYPTRESRRNEEQFQNWIEVGASNYDDNLAGSFSNYGQVSVDLFAPGTEIYSLAPDNKYERNQGTSMAAPVVSGVAAVVWAYYPKLTALQVKDILLRSAVPYRDLRVSLPTEAEEGGRKVAFGSLSKTGAVVNLYKALQMAATYKPGQTPKATGTR